MSDIIVSRDGTLRCNGIQYRCATGKGGFSLDKKEGDGATPVGKFLLRAVYFRGDKIERPKTGLPTYELQEHDGWCDDMTQLEYNTKIKLPYDGSHERLWRDDAVYDLVVDIGYNTVPIVPGKGSVIFMHIARSGYTPTEGCIALTKKDLLEVLSCCDSTTVITIA